MDLTWNKTGCRSTNIFYLTSFDHSTFKIFFKAYKKKDAI